MEMQMQMVSPEQVNRFTLGRHGLLRPFAAEPVGVVARLCGLQAQTAATPPQAIWARSEGDFDASVVSQALYEDHSLVLVWTMRGTLHLISSADLPLYHQAVQRYQLEQWTHRLTRKGTISLKELRRIDAHLLAALAGGPLTRKKLQARIPEMTDVSSGRRVDVYRVCYQGLVVHAEPAGAQARFTLMNHWLPGLDLQAIDRGQAEDALLQRYLAAYGPATVQDFAYWTGFRVGEARAILTRNQAKLAQVTVEGSRGEFWVRAEDLEELLTTDVDAPVPPRLLPRFDVLVLGHRDKARVLAPERTSDVFRPPAQVDAVILVDGRVAGTWRYQRKRRALEVTLDPWQPLADPVRDVLGAEAESLARLLGLERAILQVVKG